MRVKVAAGVIVGVQVGWSVAVPVTVAVGVRVRVGFGVNVKVAGAVSVAVEVGVGLKVEVGVTVTVRVTVGAMVAVNVHVGRAVIVFVGVAVRVTVLVGVTVGVGVGVGVTDAVQVALGVSVGAASAVVAAAMAARIRSATDLSRQMIVCFRPPVRPSAVTCPGAWRRQLLRRINATGAAWRYCFSARGRHPELRCPTHVPGEPLDPLLLMAIIDCPLLIVLPHPGHGLVNRNPCQHRHAGQGSAGSA